MAKQQIGLLVMAYGTPSTLDDVEEYYTHIRRGNPPTPEQLRDLIDRYEAIGGLSPLKEITKGQVDALEKRLNETSDEYAFKAYMGMKHAPPFIEDAVKKMAEDGIKRAVSIVLTPHYSIMSVGGYNKTASEAARANGIELVTVNNYHMEPAFIQALVERVEKSLSEFDRPKETMVLFTAHSLPEKILEMNDPYVDQLKETAAAIAEKLQLEHWETGWQSAGQTNIPWLGPDILDKMRELKNEGFDQLLVCPIGFVSDHLEILYDLDIECKELADELGMRFARTESLNVDPLYIEALSQAALKKLTEA